MPELLPVILETGLRVLLALSGLLLVLFTIMTAIRVFVLPRGDNARLARLIFRLRPSSISQSTNRVRIRRGIQSEKGTVAISRETTLPGGGEILRCLIGAKKLFSVKVNQMVRIFCYPHFRFPGNISNKFSECLAIQKGRYINNVCGTRFCQSYQFTQP